MLVDLLEKSRHVLVFTGAGVSVDSGVPDFRSPGGIWSRVDPLILSAHAFAAGGPGREAFWRVLHLLVESFGEPEPNPIHEAVVTLERMGKVVAVVTQNVDGLHLAAGTSPARLVELHGNLDWCYCTDCGARYPSGQIYPRTPPPECDACGGPVRPDAVLFGDPLPQKAVERAWTAARTCDLCIVLGSSLEVHPAAQIPVVARRSGAEVAILTISDTPLDHLAAHRSRAPLLESFVPAVDALQARV